jgi:hypothetical protein
VLCEQVFRRSKLSELVILALFENKTDINKRPHFMVIQPCLHHKEERERERGRWGRGKKKKRMMMMMMFQPSDLLTPQRPHFLVLVYCEIGSWVHSLGLLGKYIFLPNKVPRTCSGNKTNPTW